MDTANTFGLMVVCIKAILNTESGMGMEYGLIKIKLKYIQVVIEWIKKKDLEFINGQANKLIKVNFVKTIEKGSDAYMK